MHVLINSKSSIIRKYTPYKVQYSVALQFVNINLPFCSTVLYCIVFYFYSETGT